MGCRLVAIDIDGTLTWHHSQVLPQTAEAVVQTARAGYQVALCTGRSRTEAEAILEQLGGSVSYIISSDGTAVTDLQREETISFLAMPTQTAIELLDWLEQENLYYHLHYDTGILVQEGLDERFGRLGIAPHRAVVYRSQEKALEDLRAWLAAHPQRVQKISAYSRDAELLDRLQQAAAEHWQLHTTRADNLILEIMPVGGGKRHGLAMLCHRLGVAPGEVLAIGDGENDMEMFRFAGTAVAMGGAAQKVRDCADYSTGTVQQDGVGAALRLHLNLGSR